MRNSQSNGFGLQSQEATAQQWKGLQAGRSIEHSCILVTLIVLQLGYMLPVNNDLMIVDCGRVEGNRPSRRRSIIDLCDSSGDLGGHSWG